RGWEPSRSGREIKGALTFALCPIALLEVLRSFLLITCKRLVGGIWDSLREHGEVEHAQPRIAAADVGIEEAERLAGLHRLDPERHLGELDRHRVAIDAKNTGARNVAQGVAVIRGRGDAASTGARHAGSDPSGRREQEMAGAAGRVEYGD